MLISAVSDTNPIVLKRQSGHYCLQVIAHAHQARKVGSEHNYY